MSSPETPGRPVFTPTSGQGPKRNRERSTCQIQFGRAWRRGVAFGAALGRIGLGAGITACRERVGGESCLPNGWRRWKLYRGKLVLTIGVNYQYYYYRDRLPQVETNGQRLSPG